MNYNEKQLAFLADLEAVFRKHSAFMTIDMRGKIILDVRDSFPLVVLDNIDYSYSDEERVADGEELNPSITEFVKDVFDAYDTPMFTIEKNTAGDGEHVITDIDPNLSAKDISDVMGIVLDDAKKREDGNS